MQEQAFFQDLSKDQAWQAFFQALEYAFKSGAISEEVYALAKEKVFTTKQCIHSSYAAKKGANTGYTQVRYKNKKYDLHRLACALRCGPPQPDMEASHLCPDQLDRDTRACFNPAHLYWEPHLENKSRLCCLLYKKDPRYSCPHREPCLVGNTLNKSRDIVKDCLSLN